MKTSWKSIVTSSVVMSMSLASAMGQTAIRYTASTVDFPNPERGFYSHKEVQAEGAALTPSELAAVRAKNQSLILRMYYLKKFRAVDLSAAQLALMQKDFATMRTAGVKCVLRFAYSSSETDPDAPLAIVLRHLDQLKPLFESNRDVIAVVQAGFIGAWGEWYYSTNGLNNTASRQAVLAKIMQVLPSNWTAQIRTPNYKQDIYNSVMPLSQATAFNGTDIARTGHHNDCFLASADDWGTYQDTTADKIYLSLDTRFVPMGGETCALSDYSNCANAVHEMARMHWSFLNSDYNATVLNTWISGGCMDEAKRRLGYRFELLDGSFQDSVKPGGSLSASFSIANRGFAAPYKPRGVELILRNFVDSTAYAAQLSEEPRFWFSGDSVQISVTAGVGKNFPAGRYMLMLHLYDTSAVLRARPEYAIRMANENVWEASTGLNSLQHTVTVTPNAGGVEYSGPVQFLPVKTVTGVREMPSPGRLGSLDVDSFPNPFNASTVIRYSTRSFSHVSLKVYSILGSEVASLVDETEEAGEHRVYFDGHALASGVYVTMVRTDDAVAVRKLVLLK